MTRKLVTLLGITMIGEGVVAALTPRRYTQVWAWPSGPKWYTDMVDTFRANPQAVAGLAVLEGFVGLALVLGAEPVLD